MSFGTAGREAAKARFGSVPSGQRSHPVTRLAPPGEPKDRAWTMEHLLRHPGLKAIAAADHRFHGNRTARRALSDLAAAVRAAEAEHDGDDAA